MQTVADVISKWPTLAAFCADIGITVPHARVLKHRRWIPAHHWSDIESAAARRGIEGATASDLALVAARRRGETQPPTAKEQAA